MGEQPPMTRQSRNAGTDRIRAIVTLSEGEIEPATWPTASRRLQSRLPARRSDNPGAGRPCRRAGRSLGENPITTVRGHAWRPDRGYYRLASLEEANAFLTAAESFAHPQDSDPSSQVLERSTTGRLASSGIFGVSAKGAPAIWRERSMPASS